MATVIDDNLMVCVDCLMVIANGDYTGLDYHTTPNSPDHGTMRAREIDDGLDSIKGYVCAGDSENDNEFSWYPCHCCGSKLGGSRHHCVVLGD
jgi:hypothetical protein